MNRAYAKQPYETASASSGRGEQARHEFDARDGSERLFNAMALSIERLARAKRVSFDEAAVMAQNGVGL